MRLNRTIETTILEYALFSLFVLGTIPVIGFASEIALHVFVVLWWPSVLVFIWTTPLILRHAVLRLRGRSVERLQRALLPLYFYGMVWVPILFVAWVEARNGALLSIWVICCLVGLILMIQSLMDSKRSTRTPDSLQQ